MPSPSSLPMDSAFFSSFDFHDSSACSTPYLSASSSPGRESAGAGFYYSAPVSPIHFPYHSSHELALSYSDAETADFNSFEFEFDSSRSPGSASAAGPPAMSSADELFLNGQIRPGASRLLSPHLDGSNARERERAQRLRRIRSLHRKARSLTPLPTSVDGNSFQHIDAARTEDNKDEAAADYPSCVFCTSRSSSSGRNPRKWLFFKDLLLRRSRSEGTAKSKEKDRFWSSVSFFPSPPKEYECRKAKSERGSKNPQNGATATPRKGNSCNKKRHSSQGRAHVEEMKKRTYLPYRQSLFAWLGFGGGPSRTVLSR